MGKTGRTARSSLVIHRRFRWEPTWDAYQEDSGDVESGKKSIRRNISGLRVALHVHDQ